MVRPAVPDARWLWDNEPCRAACPVQEVLGPQRLHPETLKTPPATLARSRPAFTRNVFYWEDRAVGLLDPERVLAALEGNLA